MKSFSKATDFLKDICRRIYADIKKAGSALFLAAVLSLLLLIAFGKNCIFSLLIGYPCPGCGLTRATLCLLTFRFREAFFMNPSVYLIAAMAVYAFLSRYVFCRRPKYFIPLCILFGCLSICIYLIRMYFLYPHTEPMTYYTDNLLKHILDSLQ